MPEGLSFRLQFAESRIEEVARSYTYGDEEMENLRPVIRERGFLTLSDLKKVAEWKSPRSRPLIAANSDADVREITKFALGAQSEKARIEGLQILHGVGWPMASVVLHFFHRGRYPVLDYRALESCGIRGAVNYDFPFWYAYVVFCRQLAQRAGVDMRTLDRALWQYSKTQT